MDSSQKVKLSFTPANLWGSTNLCSSSRKKPREQFQLLSEFLTLSSMALHSQRIILRTAIPEDDETLVSLFTDPETMRHLPTLLNQPWDAPRMAARRGSCPRRTPRASTQLHRPSSREKAGRAPSHRPSRIPDHLGRSDPEERRAGSDPGTRAAGEGARVGRAPSTHDPGIRRDGVGDGSGEPEHACSVAEDGLQGDGSS